MTAIAAQLPPNARPAVIMFPRPSAARQPPIGRTYRVEESLRFLSAGALRVQSKRGAVKGPKISDRRVLAITSSARPFEQEVARELGKPAGRRNAYSEGAMALIPDRLPE
jgi:hypothetical protein